MFHVASQKAGPWQVDVFVKMQKEKPFNTKTTQKVSKSEIPLV